MSYNTLAGSGLQGSGPTDAEIQTALDVATLYLDSRYSWPGVLVDSTQVNDWPRQSSAGETLVDADGRELTGIPAAVLQAEVEAAKLVLDDQTLLPATVANATSSSTQGRDITEKTVTDGEGRVTTKWSTAKTESSSNNVQLFDDNGLPIIALIDAILKPIIDVSKPASTTNYRFLRA